MLLCGPVCEETSTVIRDQIMFVFFFFVGGHPKVLLKPGLRIGSVVNGTSTKNWNKTSLSALLCTLNLDNTKSIESRSAVELHRTEHCRTVLKSGIKRALWLMPL